MEQNINIIAEMQYNNGPDLVRRESQVIAEGTIGKDFQFKIINTHGMHPCAYIRIPNKSYLGNICRQLRETIDKPFYDSTIFSQIRCHGGLTFGEVFDGKSGNPLWGEGVWIGWDYGHCGDWAGYETEVENLTAGNRKWLVHDIISEIVQVVHLLADELDRPRLLRYVARDADETLHLFEVVPKRVDDRWWDRDYHSEEISREAFPDVKWEDEEPTVIILTLDKATIW